jgi:opacity protein-like surface antigen
MRNITILATAAALLLSLTSAAVVAQEINILGPGKGWKLQSQRGPEGQNVYSYDCDADVGRVPRHHASHAARRTRMVGR